MNKSYTVVWNQSKGCWSVAGESAKQRGKSSVGGVRVVAAALASAGLMALMPVANALPTGAEPTHGTVSVFSADGKNMTINQSTPKAVIKWGTFGLQNGETLTFNQLQTDMTLNYVAAGGVQSVINGKITAPGKIFIVNPSGIVFNTFASINVGSLIASAQPIDPAQFFANTSGEYVFQGGGSGSVVNNGEILARDGGEVVLLGRFVNNAGTIRTNEGATALGAGKKFTVSIGNGLLNLQVDEADVFAHLKNSGTIQANAGQVLLKARVDGAADMMQTVVNNLGVIEAKTLNGTRGKIVLDGGSRGVVEVGNRLNASALSSYGDGGSIEVQGRTVKVGLTAQVDTRALNGNTGTFKVSSDDVNVQSQATIANATIYGDTLRSNLATTNVELAATKGNVIVNAAIDWNSGTSLTLNAQNGNGGVTQLNGAVSVQGGKGALNLLADERIELNNRLLLSGVHTSLKLDTTTSAPGSGGITGKPSLANFVMTGAQGQSIVTLSGAGVSYASNGISHRVIQSVSELQAINQNLNGYYVLGADLRGGTFASIGGAYGTFSGLFDGLGHTLSNFTVSNAGSNVGLFSASSGVIRNVALDRVTIQQARANDANTSIGALVGYNSGVITNVSVKDGLVTGSSYRSNVVGGLVGTNNGGTVDRSVFSGMVRSGSYTHSIGGLVGVNTADAARILNSQSHGIVESGLQQSYQGGMGGLVGVNRRGEIRDSASTANVTSRSENVNVGGLVGTDLNGTFENVTSTGNVSAGSFSNVGGLIGRATGTAITNAQSRGKVTSGSGSNTGGLIGFGTDITVAESLSSGNVISQRVGNTGGLIGVNSGGIITESGASGAVDSTDGTNTGGLVGLNSDGGLLISVQASGAVTDWGTAVNIGGLVGTNAHASRIEHAEAKGARVFTRYSGGGTNMGGIAGHNSGEVSSSVSRIVNVTAGNYATAGGVVGHNAGIVSASLSYSNLQGGAYSNVGGLVGVNAGLVSGSALGNVTGTSRAILGGLVAQNLAGGIIRNSSASGMVGDWIPNSNYYDYVTMGGLVGINEGLVSHSITNSKLSLRNHRYAIFGGLAGINYGTFKSNTVFGEATAAPLVGINQGAVDMSY